MTFLSRTWSPNTRQRMVRIRQSVLRCDARKRRVELAVDSLLRATAPVTPQVLPTAFRGKCMPTGRWKHSARAVRSRKGYTERRLTRIRLSSSADTVTGMELFSYCGRSISCK
jgi:hypothetical protein